jgi:hypothetical protein
MKKKSYVPLNDPAEAFLIFRDELTPELTEVRGGKVYRVSCYGNQKAEGNLP